MNRKERTSKETYCITMRMVRTVRVEGRGTKTGRKAQKSMKETKTKKMVVLELPFSHGHDNYFYCSIIIFNKFCIR